MSIPASVRETLDLSYTNNTTLKQIVWNLCKKLYIRNIYTSNFYFENLAFFCNINSLLYISCNRMNFIRLLKLTMIAEQVCRKIFRSKIWFRTRPFNFLLNLVQSDTINRKKSTPSATTALQILSQIHMYTFLYDSLWRLRHVSIKLQINWTRTRSN